MKRLLPLLCALLTAWAAAPAHTAERWTPHFAYRNATQCIRVGTTLYALLDQNLLAYDTSTAQATPIDRISHGLSSKNIAHLGYAPALRLLVLIYDDGNIDLFHLDTGQVYNLPHLKNYTDAELTVRRLNIAGDIALLATSHGVVSIDLRERLVRGLYAVGACADAALFEGNVYAALSEGKVVFAPLAGNLADRTQWQEHSSLAVARLLSASKTLYLVVPPEAGSDVGVWTVAAQGTSPAPKTAPVRLGTHALQRAHLAADDTFVGEGNVQLVLYASGSTTPEIYTKTTGGNCYEPDGRGGFWVGTSNGLVQTTVVGGKVDPSLVKTTVGGYGPSMDRAYFMRYDKSDLLVTTGRLDPYEKDRVPQSAMVLRADTWHLFPLPTAADGVLGTLFESATSIARSPIDPERYAVTTVRTGVYDYRVPADLSSFSLRRQYTATNSPLVSALASPTHPHYFNYVRTDGALFDTKGNLWMLNNAADTAIWVLKTDGTWKGIYRRELEKAPTLEVSFLDSRGRLWISSRRTVTYHDGGFLCLDYNGTIDNTDDDRAAYRTDFVNQDGTACPFLSAYAIAEDRDGAMWLGTDEGIFKVDDPERWFDRDFRITQVKVPRADGTNLADYLLAGVAVTAIAVDGANRKWVGTQNNGIYLLSPDGTTTVHHFRTDNSPLPSDNIWSIACHPSDGTVMIGTDRGIIAYRSDASEPRPDLQRSSLRVYPNPVRPDYHGAITLDGLAADTEVKVTDAAGVLVATGKSLGGTFQWDGRGFDGARVGSGVYYFHLATPAARSAAVAKVAIVR